MNAEKLLQRVGQKAVWGVYVRLAVALGCAAVLTSCGDVVRQGNGNSYLILTSLAGSAGGEAAGDFTSPLLSDVLFETDTVVSVFNDNGQASLQLAMKDQVGTQPSTVNAITLTQYRVEYLRTDGHNIQGVDVPYTIDGPLTATISGSADVGFTLVRHTAKQEAPLRTLRAGASPLTVIARTTFYGADQTGRGVSVTGQMEITFSNFGNR
jgi:hypothetical protein